LLLLNKTNFSIGLLGPYATRGERERSYKLFGVVEHHGKVLSSGHYTASVKRDDIWCVILKLLVAPSPHTTFGQVSRG